LCISNINFVLRCCDNVADAYLPYERNPAIVLPDHRQVIKDIVCANPDGVLLSELSQKFEVSVY